MLKVRVRARPIEGEANEALIKLLARTLGVPRSAVTLTRGAQSRLKGVTIDNLDDEAARTRLSAS